MADTIVEIHFRPEISADAISAACSATGYTPSASIEAEALSARKARRGRVLLLWVVGIIVALAMGACGYVDVFSGYTIPGNGLLYLIASPFQLLTMVVLIVLTMKDKSFVTGGSDQSDPKSLTKRFYRDRYDLTGEHLAMLAPSTAASLATGKSLKDQWENLDKSLPGIEELKSCILAETKCCACGTSKPGVWRTKKTKPESWDLDYSQALKCPACGDTICVGCYSKMLKSATAPCPKCGQELSGVELQLGIPYPKSLWIEPATVGPVEIDQQTDPRVANVRFRAPMHWKCSGRLSESWQIEQTSRMRCVFHNAAVQIGDKWYLMSGGPGSVSVETAVQTHSAASDSNGDG